MASSKKQSAESPAEAITSLSVTGFKSLNRETTLDVRPLTILAGANSSGKSSMIQPFLLMKQTLEAQYDPGPLKLDGPNVRFTLAEQLFSRVDEGRAESLNFKTQAGDEWLAVEFAEKQGGGFELSEMILSGIPFRLEMSGAEVKKQLKKHNERQPDTDFKRLYNRSVIQSDFEFRLIRNRCFLEANGNKFVEPAMRSLSDLLAPYVRQLSNFLHFLIHVPGLRGNPERIYQKTAIGMTFPGTFEHYVASLISHWKVEKDNRLNMLSQELIEMGLTWKIDAQPVDDTRVELQVGRLVHPRQGGARDLVSIADVGFGVSQVLPVLVALIVAEPGQLVYIEQPEIHLHPRAQVALAGILADAAKRGVRVIVETHSQLLLLGVQTLVAEGKLPPESVGLNWFQRQADGSSTMIPAELDESGAFGDWPEDFADVELEAENRYLSAAEAVHFKE